MPTVSVIMPARNAAATLDAAIGSVLAQTCTDWELIVSDDASTDGTLDLIRRHAAAEPRIRTVVHASTVGAGRARNAALAIASGRFIAFLDSDDLWLPEKLSVQLPFMIEKRAALSYTDYERFNALEGPNGPRRSVKAPPTLTYDALIRRNPIGALTAIYDRSITGTVYFSDLRRSQDYALWLKILRQGHVAHGIGQSLALYRVSTAGSRTRKRIRSLYYMWKVYRQEEGLSRHSSACNVLTSAMAGLQKR